METQTRNSTYDEQSEWCFNKRDQNYNSKNVENALRTSSLKL